MNFSLLKKKYFSKKKNWESEIKNFYSDLQLIWTNCWQYNTDNSPISKKADLLCKIANKFIIKSFLGKNNTNIRKTDEMQKIDISIKNDKNTYNKKSTLKSGSNIMKNEKQKKTLQAQSSEISGVNILNSIPTSKLTVDKDEFKNPPKRKNINVRKNSKAEEENKITYYVENLSQINTNKKKEVSHIEKKIENKKAKIDSKTNMNNIRKEITNNKKRIDDSLSEEESEEKIEKVEVNKKNQDLLNKDCKKNIIEKKNNISNNLINDEITEVKHGEILKIETSNENELSLSIQNENMKNDNEIVDTSKIENNIEKMKTDTPFEDNQIEIKPIHDSLNSQANMNEMIEKTIGSEKEDKQMILDEENLIQKINYKSDAEETKQINNIIENEEKNCEENLVNRILKSPKSLEKNENIEDVTIDNNADIKINKNTKKPRIIKSIKDKAFDLQDDIFNFSNRLPNKISDKYQIRDIITTNHKRERKQVDYKKRNNTKILSDKINEENSILLTKSLLKVETLEKKSKFINDMENEEGINNKSFDNDENQSISSDESRLKKNQLSNRKLNIENNKNENTKEKQIKKTKQKKKNSDVISTIELESEDENKNNIRKANKIIDETFDSENVNIKRGKKKKRNSLNIKKSADINLKNQKIYELKLNEDFQSSEKAIKEDLK